MTAKNIILPSWCNRDKYIDPSGVDGHEAAAPPDSLTHWLGVDGEFYSGQQATVATWPSSPLVAPNETLIKAGNFPPTVGEAGPSNTLHPELDSGVKFYGQYSNSGYFEAPTGAPFDPGPGAWCGELLFKFNSIAGTYQMPFTKFDPGSSLGFWYGLALSGQGRVNYNTYNFALSAVGAFVAGTWYLMHLPYDFDAGQGQIWLNGAPTGAVFTTPPNDMAMSAPSGLLNIGRYGPDGARGGQVTVSWAGWFKPTDSSLLQQSKWAAAIAARNAMLLSGPP